MSHPSPDHHPATTPPGRPRRSIPGAGLARGLAVTLRTMTRKSVTEQYPDALPELPPRTRGVIGLFEENCTVCMLCARECPDWCIYIDSHKGDGAARRPRWPGAQPQRPRPVRDRLLAVHVLRYLHRGLSFRRAVLVPGGVRRDRHPRPHPRAGQAPRVDVTVPAPPALDPGAEEPKEIAAARKTAEKLAAAQAEPADPQEGA
ncbi:NADH-quinone oxidoreductase subunit I [Streptomyces tricolor]|nr:NADH-quinone oxidoreductase subunit I [Streptomyces tricolor]